MCSGVDLEQDDQEQREVRSPRVLRCELIDTFGRSHSCLMRNISRRGVGGSGCDALAVGERVKVVLPAAGAVSGTVRWVVRDKFGINLDCEIDTEAVRFTGASNNASQQQQPFRVMDMHRVTNDCRRPGLRIS